jgi:hypothetical protein
MQILKWIEQWYLSHCDGDWEHQYVVEIRTIGNPGWTVKIDLAETGLEHLSLEYSVVEKSETNWYGYSVKNSMFEAAGDPSKLQFLLELFRKTVEENTK